MNNLLQEKMQVLIVTLMRSRRAAFSSQMTRKFFVIRLKKVVFDLGPSSRVSVCQLGWRFMYVRLHNRCKLARFLPCKTSA